MFDPFNNARYYSQGQRDIANSIYNRPEFQQSATLSQRVIIDTVMYDPNPRHIPHMDPVLAKLDRDFRK
jgi:hypothetical protein